MVDLSSNEEGEHWGETLLEQRRDLPGRIKLSPEGCCSQIVLGTNGGNGIATFLVGDHLEVSGDFNALAELLPVCEVGDAGRLHLTGGNPVLVVARVLGEICGGDFRDARLWSLPVALDTKSKIFGERLEVASNIDTRRVDRVGVHGLDVGSEVRTLVFVLKVDHVMADLLGKLRRIRVRAMKVRRFDSAYLGLRFRHVVGRPPSVETGTDAAFVVDATLKEDLQRCQFRGV